MSKNKYKANKALIRLLDDDYTKACNGWVNQLLLMWELNEDSGYGYWAGDQVGGVYCYGEFIFIDMENIIYCVKNDVTEKEFMEWSEYCTWANEFHQPTPNLRSWMNGCPRCSKEEMEHLTELKKKFMDEVKILAEKNQSETF